MVDPKCTLSGIIVTRGSISTETSHKQPENKDTRLTKTANNAVSTVHTKFSINDDVWLEDNPIGRV